MPSNPLNKSTRGWYTVSVDTLRGAAIIAAFAALALGGYGLYRQWGRRALEQEARGGPRPRSRSCWRAPTPRSPRVSFVEELESARRRAGPPAPSFAAGDYRESRSARGAAAGALCSPSSTPCAAARLPGEAQFIAAQGGVEYRRGDRGEWEEARARVVLQSGDYVKTSANGSAEIVFLDGTLYTVRPNTLFLVTRRPARRAASPPSSRSQWSTAGST